MGSRGRLVALVGAGCLGLLCNYIPKFEGTILRGYKDPIGIVTACTGHTKTAIFGKPYTKDECEELLVQDLEEHAEGVLACTPVLRDQPFRLAASISFAFNIGVDAYCHSATARRFNAGDWTGGCRAMNENDSGKPQWVYATQLDGTKIVLPGLVERRSIERQLCETGLLT